MLRDFDMTTPESHGRALREVCRVEGNASSTAINESANWQSVDRCHCYGNIHGGAGIEDSDQGSGCGRVPIGDQILDQELPSADRPSRISDPPPLVDEHFSTAAIAFAEGCALRQFPSGEITRSSSRPVRKGKTRSGLRTPLEWKLSFISSRTRPGVRTFTKWHGVLGRRGRTGRPQQEFRVTVHNDRCPQRSVRMSDSHGGTRTARCPIRCLPRSRLVGRAV